MINIIQSPSCHESIRIKGEFLRLFCSCATVMFFVLSVPSEYSFALEYENCSGSTNLEYEWGAGAVVRNAGSIDYNKDGYQDLFLTWTSGSNEGSVRVWKGIQPTSNGVPRFFLPDSSPFSGTAPSEGTTGFIFADFDNDGWTDFYAPCPTGHKLFRYNPSLGKFDDVTTAMGLNSLPLTAHTHTIGGSWGDFNGDSYIDLLILVNTQGSTTEDEAGNMSEAQLLLQNNAGLGFTNATNVGFESSQQIMSALWADFDNDLDLDLVLVQGANETGVDKSKYLENNGNGTLTAHAPAAPDCFEAFNKQNNYACVTDVNNDGLLDVVFRSQSSRGYSLTGSNGPVAEVELVTDTFDLPLPWDLGILDYDLDGWQDFIVSEYDNGHTPKVFRNSGSPDEPVFDPAFLFNLTPSTRGLCLTDFSRNGYKEAFLSQGQSGTISPSFYFWHINSVTYPQQNWIGVDLVSPGGTNNYNVIGATVIESGKWHTQAQLVDGGSGRSSQQDLSLVFGLGAGTEPVDFTISLPSGDSAQITGIEPNRYQTLSVDDPMLEDGTVSVEVLVDPATGLERYTFTWTTQYWSDKTQDSITFLTGASYPGGCLPNGTSTYVGGGSMDQGANGKYHHKLSVNDVQCSAGCRYYYQISSKIGSFMGAPSNVRSFKRLYCVGN